MPTTPKIAELHPEITRWRRHIHENPGLMYDVEHTASFVAEHLRDMGVDEVATGIGQTGVVGVIHGKGQGSGKVLGMRADMDALPILEETGKSYASKVPGKMHACGHDGHTAMLLGAARYLSGSRDFDGTAVMIFQPAEEGGAGGKAMVEDGLMDRFGIQEVYGMHNMPGLAVGEFAIRTGPLLAATDELRIELEGVGGHAAMPHRCVDTVVVATALVQALQSVVARNVDPLQSAVLSITQIHAGDAFNVIPQRAELCGTVRTLDPEVRDLMEQRVREVVETLPKAYGARGTLHYERGYPVTCNHAEQTETAIRIASGVVGSEKVEPDTSPMMGGEDFSFMLEARPGAFILVGNGDTAALHHPLYDFNDEAIPVGCSYWIQLAEQTMPLA